MGGNYWEGRTVRLRAIEPGDAERHILWNLDSEAARRFDQLDLPASRESVRRWAQQTSLKGGDDGFHFEIETLEAVPVGMIVTDSCNQRNGTFEIGVAISAEQQRRGYASEAIRIVLRYYFEELRYQKVTAWVYSFNEPSILLFERLGFRREGQLRRMLYTRGGHSDLLIFGLTGEEFAAHAQDAAR